MRTLAITKVNAAVIEIEKAWQIRLVIDSAVKKATLARNSIVNAV